MDPTTVVNVRFPHKRLGLAGKPLNQSKQALREQFLTLLIVTHSQMDDRKILLVYFSHKFTTIQANVAHYEERLGRSVMGEFNSERKASLLRIG